jgi:hypothetical protein
MLEVRACCAEERPGVASRKPQMNHRKRLRTDIRFLLRFHRSIEIIKIQARRMHRAKSGGKKRANLSARQAIRS